MLLRTLLILSALPCTLLARDIVITFTFPKGEQSEITSGTQVMNRPLEPLQTKMKVKPNRPVVLELIRECRYPIEFAPAKFDPKTFTNLAETAQGKGGLVPQTPLTFETTNAGWTVEMTAVEGAEFITLYAKAHYSKVELLQAAHGEGSSPITRVVKDGKGKAKTEVISPNVAQSGVSDQTTTNFQLYATPGKPYKIPVRRGGKTIEVIVTCDYVK